MDPTTQTNRSQSRQDLWASESYNRRCALQSNPPTMETPGPPFLLSPPTSKTKAGESVSSVRSNKTGSEPLTEVGTTRKTSNRKCIASRKYLLAFGHPNFGAIQHIKQTEQTQNNFWPCTHYRKQNTVANPLGTVSF